MEKTYHLPINVLEELEKNSNSLLKEEIDELSFQATAYEKAGFIDFDEFMNDFITEELSDDELVRNYIEYSQEDYDGGFFDYDTLINCYLEGMSAEDILRLGYFSKDLYNSDYLRFNGYGNIEGVSEYEILEEAKNNRDFLEWLIEYSDNKKIEEIKSDKDIIIQGALKLVELGY